MPYLFFGIVLLGLLLLSARIIVNTDAAQLGRQLGWIATGVGVTGAAALFALLIASDRFGPAIAIAGAFGSLAYRWQARRRRDRSEVATTMLRMRLDHKTGVMTGQVRRGSFAGRQLEDLDQNELISLWRQCVADDEQGARLLETYLDRLWPEWRQTAGSGSGGGAAPGEAMTREQAYKILDLAPGADAAQIKEAHRRLMMKLHPDHGGSTFLAAQINRAKDILLGD